MDTADLPDNHALLLAHAHSIFHRAEIEASSLCGCFYCQRTFAPHEIKEWVDDTKPQAEWTAICPFCWIDSVIGDKSGFPLTREFLRDMNKLWF
jgi:hypothetical protein